MWVQSALISLPNSGLPPLSPKWTPELLIWLPAPPINSQPRVIIAKHNVVTLLMMKIFPGSLWLPMKGAQSPGRPHAWPWEKGHQTLLSSFPLCAQGLHLVFTRPKIIQLPFRLLSLPTLPSNWLIPQTGQLLFLKQVQPTPTSGPLHMTASLPGPVSH